LKDVKGKQTIGIPFLGKIPFIGKLFTREVVDNQKVDLLIFITARVVKDGEFTPEEIAKLEKGMNTLVPKEKATKKKTKPDGSK
jgi:type II secretory pathway component GspD/PulD (secretin)